MSICDCYNSQGSANEGEELFSYTIITVDSTPSLKWLHNRMPVILIIISLQVSSDCLVFKIILSLFATSVWKYVTLKVYSSPVLKSTCLWLFLCVFISKIFISYFTIHINIIFLMEQYPWLYFKLLLLIHLFLVRFDYFFFLQLVL